METIKNVSIKAKAQTLMEYKRYVEKRQHGYTYAQCRFIDYQCYLLTILAERPEYTKKLLPHGTRVVCVKLPSDRDTSLEIGKEYTVSESWLSEFGHSILLKETGEEKFTSGLFDIAKEDVISKQQALEMYGDAFDADYLKASEYYDRCEKNAEEERKAREAARKAFRKIDLRTGDITVSLDGLVGMVVLEKNCIFYGNNGYAELEFFDEKLVSELEENDTVKEVYRSNSMITFGDYEEGDLVFER